MNKAFIKLDEEFDFMRLRNDVITVYNNIKRDATDNMYVDLVTRNISLTARQPDSDDWTDGVAGKTFVNQSHSDNSIGLKTQLGLSNDNEMLKETEYVYPINQVKGTYIEELINKYDFVCRWRISILPPRTTLSIHVDGSPLMNTLQGGGAVMDWRLHFPIQTNNRCFLVNWPSNFGTPKDTGEEVTTNMANFKSGNAYLLNTSMMHCATNYSTSERIHLIASCDTSVVKNFSVR